MAGTRIDQLPTISGALTGNELVPVEQFGITAQVTSKYIAPWTDATGTALITPSGGTVAIGGGGGVAFGSSVSDSPGASQNNYSPTGYTGGTTNRLLLTAHAGGTTLTGLVAATDGWTVYVRNTSATDTLTFAHLSGSSSAANQFSCPQGVNAALQPLTGALLIYVVNQWVFA